MKERFKNWFYRVVLNRKIEPKKTKLYETKVSLVWGKKVLGTFPLTVAAQDKKKVSDSITKEIKLKHTKIKVAHLADPKRKS